MSAKKEYIIYSLILFGFIFFCYVILDIPAIDPIWNFFADPQDYLRQSNYPLFSKEFYIPEPAMWFTPRPFTVPLFYKLAGSEPERMLYFQKAFYCFSVGVFVVCVLRFLAHHVLKLVMALVLFFFFTWWNIVGWSNNILSESISFSFFLLVVGTFWFHCETQLGVDDPVDEYHLVFFIHARHLALSHPHELCRYCLI